MKNDPIIEVWVTKYALTSGIQHHTNAEHCVGTSTRMIKVPGPYGGACFHGDDWHRTRADAAAHAEKMRDRKIAALEKQIKKLRAMTFART